MKANLESLYCLSPLSPRPGRVEGWERGAGGVRGLLRLRVAVGDPAQDPLGEAEAEASVVGKAAEGGDDAGAELAAGAGQDLGGGLLVRQGHPVGTAGGHGV